MVQKNSPTARRLLAIGAPRKFREGGMVRGPGGATSDSIPARLSDGEFVLPADTVRKVGVKSLRALVRRTHEPSGNPVHPARFADGGQVDEERQLKNSFGDAAAAAQIPNVQVVGAPPSPGTLSPDVSQPSVSAPASVAMPSVSASAGTAVDGPSSPSDSWSPADTAKAATLAAGGAAYGAGKFLEPVATGLGYKGPGQMATDIAKTAAKEVTGAKLPGAPTGMLAKLGALGALASTAVEGMNTPTEQYRQRFGMETNDPSFAGDLVARTLGVASDLGNGMTLGLAGKLFRDKTDPAVPAPTPDATRGRVAGPPSAAGDANMPAMDASARLLNFGGASARTVTAPQTQSNVTKTVGPDGKVSYSGGNVAGDITINGGAGRGTVTDLGGQGMTSAERIDQYNRIGALYRDIGALRQKIQQGEDVQNSLIPSGGMAVLGSSPSSLFERAPEQQLRDARVSANTLLSAKDRNPRTGLSPQDIDLANVRRDQADERKQANDLAVQGVRTSGDLAQQTMRSNVESQGNNQRYLADLGRLRLDARKQSDLEATSVLERQKLGYQNQSTQRVLNAQTELENAKTPAEQRSARERLLAFMGKADNDAWAYAPGGQIADPKSGMPVTQPGVIFNRYTGETRTQPAQTGASVAPREGSTVRGKDGNLYVVRNGRPVPVGK